MAISYVNFSSYEFTTVQSSPISLTIDIGTRTNGLLVVGISGMTTNEILSMNVSWNGVWMSLARSYREVGGRFSRLYYLANPANGSNTLQINYGIDLGGTLNWGQVLTSWYDGVAQTSPLDQYLYGTGTTDPAVDITPTEDNELIVSQYVSNANSVLTVGAGETKIDDFDAGANVTGGSYAIQTTKATQTIDWAGTNDTWVMTVASFKPYVAAGGGGKPAYYYQMLNRRR